MNAYLAFCQYLYNLALRFVYQPYFSFFDFLGYEGNISVFVLEKCLSSSFSFSLVQNGQLEVVAMFLSVCNRR